MKKNILITGGAQRIGKEISIFFGIKGWNIVIHFHKSKNESIILKKKILSMGVLCMIVQGDLSKLNDVKSVLKVAKKKMGTIDCLVNCASIFENDDILNFNNQKWQSHFDVNLKAPAILSGEFAKQKKNIQGNIVNIIDQRVFKLTPYFLSYTLSKAGLETLTKTLAMKFAPKIRVNAIAPGPVMKNKRQSQKHFEKQFKNTILKKQTKVINICKTIEFILANDSITGLTIPVDSGQNLAWKTPDLVNIKE